MKYLTSSKGAVTLFVLVCVIFFLIALVNVQVRLNNKEAKVEEEYQKIKQDYKMGTYVKNKDYTELEYIESTGTQWINTEQDCFNKTTEVKYLADGQFSNYGNVIIGCEYTSSSVRYHCTLYNNSYYYADNNKERSSGVSDYGKVHTIQYNSKRGFLVVDDKVTDSTTFEPIKGNTIYIGRRVANNLYSKMKYYSVKIYDKDTDKLILDLIPVLDNNNNNKPCMYDRIGRKFYYNAGTGEFLYKEK